MALVDFVLEQLAVARKIVDAGEEVVPAWRIITAEGHFLILTQFDEDKPDQRERVRTLIAKFMTWKMATAYVVTAETWLGPVLARGGDEALLGKA